MKIDKLHSWNISTKEAAEIQREFQKRIILQRRFKEIKFVAGADMAIDDRDFGIAGIIVYSFPDLKEIERVHAIAPIKFPYIPGLLAFREAPVLLEAFEKLETEPDIIMIDGQGIAHPRGMGIASHMGLFLGKPTIGCAKSRLIGDYDEPGRNVGDWTPLSYQGKTVGAVLRTRKDVKPIFVSPGHLIDLDSSIEIALACLDRTRIPKPTREADHYVSRLKKVAI